MESWNREELYGEVWDQPLTKLRTKYGISAVALGKVCKKLKIPLPGRGYWAKKEFGKAGERPPLPRLKEAPVVWRTKFPTAAVPRVVAAPEPTDAEWSRIREIEGKAFVVVSVQEYPKLVKATAKRLASAKADERGILIPRHNETSLDIRVSKNTLGRALSFIGTVIRALESEAFFVEVKREKHGTVAKVFGQSVWFGIVEKTKEIGRREVTEYSWKRTVIDYLPSGTLEFRVGSAAYGLSRTLRDGKKARLEDLTPQAVGAVLREARELREREARRKQEEVEERQRASERIALAEQIREEEEKVKQFERWVEAWRHTREMRAFILELEKVWAAEGCDLSEGAPSSERLRWMNQQADRSDPFITDKPASILDRKGELRGW